MRNNTRKALRGLGDCLGICHKGDRELKDNRDIGLHDGEIARKFKLWSWY